MTSQELEDVKRIARVIRAGRKLIGKDQRAVASLLGVSQAAISKIESEILMPSASQWYKLCQEFKIDPEYCYRTGYIDNCSSVWTASEYIHNRFKIPKKYLTHSRSKVRSVKPFFKFFQSRCGEQKLAEYLENLKIDPDFFLVYDNQLNMKFSLDLICWLIQNRYLKRSDIPVLVQSLNSGEMHGRLHEVYSHISSKKQLIYTLIKNVSKYETNSVYAIVDEMQNSFFLSIAPSLEMKLFDHKNDTLGDFICDYKKEYIKQFCTYIDSTQVKIHELDCYFKGKEKCLYKITL